MTSEVEALRALLEAGARFVLVGAYGANLHAMEVGVVITTMDCDVLIEPSQGNLLICLEALARAGYALETAGEPFEDRDPATLSRVIEMGSNVKAVLESTQIDLMTQALDMRYQDLELKAKNFLIEGVKVPVAPIEDILRSKMKANRPKDRLFLAMYHDALTKLGVKVDPLP